MNATHTILLVSNTARSFYLFRRHLITDLIGQGYRVVCAAAPDSMTDKVRALGAEFVAIQMDRSGMNPLAEARCLWGLAQLLRQYRPDLVISYTIKPNTYVPILARVLGIPTLAVITGLGYAFIDKGYAARIARLIMRIGTGFASYIWALNQDDVATLQRHGVSWARRVSVIPGEGIDTVHFAPRPLPEYNGVHFFMNARILIDKGIREYVGAAAQVHKTYPNAQFHLVGAIDHGNPNAMPDGEWQDILKAGHIFYHGTTDDVRPFIAQTDCTVLPSYREGVPLVLLEAAAMARPIIASDVAGCRDVVRAGKTGLLCRARDAQDLVQKMIDMIEMGAGQRTLMGQAARIDVVERFDVTKILAAYRRLLADVWREKK